MTQRYRQEAATIQRLVDCDVALAGRAEILRATVDPLDGAAMIEKSREIQEGLKALETSLMERQAALLA
jgi:hypothetical protein